MSERIKEIRERLEKATPGPWETVPTVGNAVIAPDADGGYWTDVADRIETEPDAAFIANATTDVAWLLSEVERLRAKNRELNRRCTKAEAFVGKTVDELRAAPGFAGFGRALANWAAENERRNSDERAARAWDEGYRAGVCDEATDAGVNKQNPYRKETT